MRSLTLTLAVLFALVAAPARAQTDPFQFVGFSTGTFDGSAGVLQMSAACLVDFGIGARMCMVCPLEQA